MASLTLQKRAILCFCFIKLATGSWACVAGTEMHCSDSSSRQDTPPAVEVWVEGGSQMRTLAGSASATESSLAWARSLPRLLCTLWLSAKKRLQVLQLLPVCGDWRSPLSCSCFTMTRLQLDFLLCQIPRSPLTFHRFWSFVSFYIQSSVFILTFRNPSFWREEEVQVLLQWKGKKRNDFFLFSFSLPENKEDKKRTVSRLEHA